MTDTVEDRHGAEAPAELDGVDLTDGCPACGADDPPVFTEQPAGYYTCDTCFCTWSGDIHDASLVAYFNPDSWEDSR